MSLRYDNTTVKQLIDLPKLIETVSKELLEEKTEEMVLVAKGLCPVQTGTLQKTIRKERSGNNILVRAGGFYVNPRSKRICDYAVIVEMKTGFMRSAWAYVSKGIEEEIQNRVKEKSGQ
jgi:hypothetical protein